MPFSRQTVSHVRIIFVHNDPLLTVKQKIEYMYVFYDLILYLFMVSNGLFDKN